MPTLIEDRRHLTVRELAERLHVHTSWVYRRVASREIEYTGTGRLVRFTPDQVAAIEESLRVAPRAPRTRRRSA